MHDLSAGLFRRYLDRLPIAVERVFNDHASVVDLNDFVAPLHNFTLFGDKHFTIVVKEDFLRLVGFAGKAIKLERNGRRWRRRSRGGGYWYGSSPRSNTCKSFFYRRRFFHPEDISASFIFLALAGCQDVDAQSWIERV